MLFVYFLTAKYLKTHISNKQYIGKQPLSFTPNAYLYQTIIITSQASALQRNCTESADYTDLFILMHKICKMMTNCGVRNEYMVLHT